MKTIGYVRVSTEKQADFGVSIDAKTAKIRAMAVVQGAELADVIIDAGESAKSLQRPGMTRLLALVDAGAVELPRDPKSSARTRQNQRSACPSKRMGLRRDRIDCRRRLRCKTGSKSFASRTHGNSITWRPPKKAEEFLPFGAA